MRVWTLPDRRVEQRDYPPGLCCKNIFWYCRFCGSRYAELRYANKLPSEHWGVKAGLCRDCVSVFWGSIPGSIGFHMYSLGLPYEVLAYELDCEFRFLDAQCLTPNKGLPK